MALVIDTNIIFSALLDRKAREFNIITWGSLNLYVCLFSTIEIFKNKEKLQTLSGLTDHELLDTYYMLLKRLQIVHEEDIPREAWKKASELVMMWTRRILSILLQALCLMLIYGLAIKN